MKSKRIIKLGIILILLIVGILSFPTIKNYSSNINLLAFFDNTTYEERPLSEVVNTMYVTLLDEKAKVVASTNPETEVDTINIYKNNIYYLKKKDEIPSMYKNNGKKEIKVKENVGYFTINENTMYYIGDYNISQKYGNLFRYNSKRILDKRVTSLHIK